MHAENVELTNNKHKAIISGTPTNVTKGGGFPCLITRHYQGDLRCHGGNASVGQDQDLC